MFVPRPITRVYFYLVLIPLVHGKILDVVCKIPIIGHLFSCIAERVESDLSPTIYSNPYDGRVFSLVYNDTKVTLYGASFKEIALPLTLVAESAENSKATIVLGENNTISSMVVEDGIGGVGVFEFSMTDSALDVQFNLPNENYRGFVALDPIPASGRKLKTYMEGPHPAAQDEGAANHSNLRRQKSRGLQPDPSVGTPGSVNIFVAQCGQNNVSPLDLTVTATANGEDVPVSVLEGADGSYTAFLAVEAAEPVSETVLDSVCDTISSAAQICPIFEALGPASVVYSEGACAAIVTALAATVAGAPYAPLVGTLCVAGVTGALTFCEAHSMAGGGLPPGAPNALEEACAALASGASAVEDLYFQTEVTVTAEALLSSGETVSGSSTFTPANGVSGEAIILSGSGSPQLVNFEANPPNPIAGEGYLATADVICADSQTVVTMDVVGSDNYDDIKTCAGSCSLDVPGADQGVTDTITVRIEHPSIPSPGVVDVIGLIFR